MVDKKVSKVRNSLVDLNDLLFEEMEALSNPDLTAEQLELELNRAKGLGNVATRIIENGRLILDAQKYTYDNGYINNDAGNLLASNDQRQIDYTNGGTKK